MIQLLLRFVSTAGTAITVASILWANGESAWTTVHFFLTGLFVIATAATICDVLQYFRTRPKTFELASAKIQSYMSRWLKSGGRAAVFSRDLSWATGEPLSTLLRQKAQQGELIAFVGRSTEQVSDLAALGGDVHDYSKLPFVPKSRFTIVDFDKVGARLAIGIQQQGKHVIYEYGASDIAVMALAIDLVELASAALPKSKT